VTKRNAVLAESVTGDDVGLVPTCAVVRLAIHCTVQPWPRPSNFWSKN